MPLHISLPLRKSTATILETSHSQFEPLPLFTTWNCCNIPESVKKTFSGATVSGSRFMSPSSYQDLLHHAELSVAFSLVLRCLFLRSPSLLAGFRNCQSSSASNNQCYHSWPSVSPSFSLPLDALAPCSPVRARISASTCTHVTQDNIPQRGDQWVLP
jgi:hypothetical protein